MTLAEWADVGELVGGIAVVASLVYLALQIRQNTRTVRGATLQQNTEIWSTLLLRIAEPDIAQAYVAGMAGHPEIRPLHYTQFFFICRAMFVAFENQYYQRRQDVLDAATYAGYERTIATQFLAFRGFRLWWQQSRSVFSPVFAAHIDALIASLPEAEPDAIIREWTESARREAAAGARPSS